MVIGLLVFSKSYTILPNKLINIITNTNVHQSDTLQVLNDVAIKYNSLLHKITLTHLALFPLL